MQNVKDHLISGDLSDQVEKVAVETGQLREKNWSVGGRVLKWLMRKAFVTPMQPWLWLRDANLDYSTAIYLILIEWGILAFHQQRNALIHFGVYIMSNLEKKLREMGEQLPPAKTPVANYLGCKLSGDILYVSGRVSQIRGEVGSDVDLAQAKAAAKGALLDLLAIIKAEIGDLDRIVSVEKMVGFVRSAPTFIQQPQVIDGASDLLVELFGENGRHARTATGVAQLPSGAAVQLEMVLRLKDSPDA